MVHLLTPLENEKIICDNKKYHYAYGFGDYLVNILFVLKVRMICIDIIAHTYVLMEFLNYGLKFTL